MRAKIVLLIVFAIGVLIGSCCRGNDLQAAVIDRNQFPRSEWGYIYYFGFEPIPKAERDGVLASLCFVCASSSTTKIVEDCLPVPITDTLYRIDIRSLNWDVNQSAKVFARSPYKRYHHKNATLVNHPGWFVLQVSDSTESQAYNQLLYGKENPTEQDFYKLTETNLKTEIRKLEGRSGVASNQEKDRILRIYDNGRFTITTITDDFFRLGADKSLLLLKNETKPDGKEGIGGLVKVSETTGDRFWLMYTWQGNGKGEYVAEVPQLLATQKRGWRGSHSAIVGPGGCWKCHSEGYKPMTQDLFSHYLKNTVIESKSYEKIQQARSKYLESVQDLFTIENKKYSLGVKASTGYEPAEFFPLYEQSINWYDEPVSLEQAAKELYQTPENLETSFGLCKCSRRTFPP